MDLMFYFAGQSSVLVVNDPVRELFPRGEVGGTGSILLDAVLCRRAVHEDDDGLRRVKLGKRRMRENWS